MVVTLFGTYTKPFSAIIPYFLTLSITFAFDKINDLENYSSDIYIIELSENLDSVKENGIYNAYLTAIAPTQSISYVQNATSSIMPITEQIEVRTYGDSTTIYPMPFLTNENMLWYQSAYRMDMRKVIDIVATAQEHIDQGISTTLFVTDDKTTRDIARYYIYAYKKGLKSLYYTRTKMTREDTECITCSV